jgi:hypothetical protein
MAVQPASAGQPQNFVTYVGDLDIDVFGRGPRGGGGGGGLQVGSIVDISPVAPDPARQREGNLWYEPMSGRIFLFAWGAWFGPIV